MLRRLCVIILLLLFGAIVNIAVAWGLIWCHRGEIPFPNVEGGDPPRKLFKAGSDSQFAIASTHNHLCTSANWPENTESLINRAAWSQSWINRTETKWMQCISASSSVIQPVGRAM